MVSAHHDAAHLAEDAQTVAAAHAAGILHGGDIQLGVVPGPDPSVAASAPVDRDVYSAFLARFVREDQLDTRQVPAAWPPAEPLVRLPVSSLPNCKRRALRGLGGRKPSDRAVRQSKARSAMGNSGDAVGRKPESRGKTWSRPMVIGSSPARIPCL